MNLNKVRGRIVELGMTKKQFCSEIGIEPRTFDNYKKHPERIKYGTLVKMIDVLCRNQDDVIDIFFS